MKRHFYTLGLMLAATFTLTNCAQEIDNPNDVPSAGIPFEIVATSAETKTVNDGLNTKWVAGDQINIFHAVAETNAYVADGAFTVAEADVATGRFTGTLSAALESDKVYDWYALYPYSEHVTTPGEHDEGYTYIGHSKGLNQSGYDSMASLKGSVCPLYGIATAVPEGTKPSMTMNHISSIVAINVINATEEALTVTTASLTAEEDIVGSYFIDITKSPVVCTPSAANYVNNTATVNVSGGTELAQGESAILYLAIKPFTAATGEKLVISVNGYSKELTMTKDVTFTAGKIKTLNFSYDKVEEPAPDGLLTATLTFDADKTNRKSYSTSEQVWEQNGITFTNTKASSTNNIADYANPVRLYKSSTISVEAPGYITKIEFNSASGEYLTNLKNSISGATASGTVVTVELDGSSTSVEYTLSGGQARLNSLTVTYSTADYVPPTLESIAVSGDYKTEFTQGATFSFGGVVTATYDDESTKNVTDDCTFSGYDMSVVGDQTVTVTYEGVTATYDITVNEKQQGSIELKTFIVKSGDVVGNSAYNEYSGNIDGRGWIITCGGNNKSVGVNSSNRAKCTLSSYSKYAVSPVTTSSTASAFASTTSISNVSKISYAALSGGSNHASTKIYVLYSADGTTFSQLTLTNGTQGETISTTAGGEFEFASCSGYFAVVFVATNTSGNWRLDDVNLTFTYSE